MTKAIQECIMASVIVIQHNIQRLCTNKLSWTWQQENLAYRNNETKSKSSQACTLNDIVKHSYLPVTNQNKFWLPDSYAMKFLQFAIIGLKKMLLAKKDLPILFQ